MIDFCLKRILESRFNPLHKVCAKIVEQYGKNHWKWYSNYLYKYSFGRSINWNNPTEFNEKIRWMLLYTDTSLWTTLSDKYQVKVYLMNKGYGDVIPKLYGKWDNVEDIDFNMLPNEFVIKTNHGCKGVYVVKDKSKSDINKIKKGLSESLSNVFGYESMELHYLPITHCIIAEELISNEKLFSNSIVDYKFYCFNGVPECCAVFYNRDVQTHDRSGAIYDMNWERHPEWLNPNVNYKDADIPRPVHFERMKQLCTELTTGIPFVRLDLYETNDKVYIGEFTFTPAALGGGSLNPNLFMKYGEKIDLNLCQKKILYSDKAK